MATDEDTVSKESPKEYQTPEERSREYYQLKQEVRVLRGDLRDLKDSNEDNEELKQVTEKAKNLRQKINNNEDIRMLSDKIATMKERMELLKDIIKEEMIQEEKDEIKVEDRKLKIVKMLKDTKADEG